MLSFLSVFMQAADGSYKIIDAARMLTLLGSWSFLNTVVLGITYRDRQREPEPHMKAKMSGVQDMMKGA